MGNIVLSVTDEEFIRMKAIAMDRNTADVLEFIRLLLKRIDAKKKGVKSHLDG
jgi:hypothetical protein